MYICCKTRLDALTHYDTILDNDLAFPENKLVSQRHCKITQEEDGIIYITDSR